jgi:multiple antibiotic resistance protein
MLDFSEYTQFFIAMLAIVDPITILPLYLHLVRHLGVAEQTRLAGSIALATTIALVVTVFVGQKVLTFFGISIGAFQIAGGLLLLMVALQLMRPADGASADDLSSKPIGPEQVVVPLAIPLLAGPGAFSTVIVFSFRSDTWSHLIVLSLCLLALGLIVWLALRAANQFMVYLSATSIAVINKIMGLILAAIAIEFVAAGIKALFHL